MAAWFQIGDNAGWSLFASRYDRSTGRWATAVEISPSPLTGMAESFSMASDPDGIVTMAWARNNGMGGSPTIEAARFDPTSGTWTAPVRVDQTPDNTGGAYGPSVVVSAAGYSTVAWLQWDGMYAARLGPNAQAWSTPHKLTPPDMGAGQYAPSLTVDVAGNVKVVFRQAEQITSFAYLADTKEWQPPVVISTPASGTTLFSNAPVTVVDPSGTVTAVWFAQNELNGAPQYVVQSNSSR